MEALLALLARSQPLFVVPKAMCALNFAFTFTFEIKLAKGNIRTHEIIIVTSASRWRIGKFLLQFATPSPADMWSGPV